MKDYYIFMDVSGDICVDDSIRDSVKYIPMSLTIGEEATLYNGKNSPEELKKFYDDIRGGAIVKTSQIPPYIYEEYFTPYLKDGKDILYLCLSSGLSSTFDSAFEAAKNLEKSCPEAKLYPVDSLSATGGMGMIIERAISNKQSNAKRLAKPFARRNHTATRKVHRPRLLPYLCKRRATSRVRVVSLARRKRRYYGLIQRFNRVARNAPARQYYGGLKNGLAKSCNSNCIGYTRHARRVGACEGKIAYKHKD